MEDYEKLYKSKEITNVEYAKAVFGEKVLDKNYGMGIKTNLVTDGLLINKSLDPRE